MWPINYTVIRKHLLVCRLQNLDHSMDQLSKLNDSDSCLAGDSCKSMSKYCNWSGINKLFH